MLILSFLIYFISSRWTVAKSISLHVIVYMIVYVTVKLGFKFFDKPNITVKCSSTLNPASLLPNPENVESHILYVLLVLNRFALQDLTSQKHLINPDLKLFINKSASHSAETGHVQEGYS